jgi:hypothetical protein
MTLARIQFYRGKANRPATMRKPLPCGRRVTFASYRTMYRAYLEAMRERYPARCLTQPGPPVTFEQWSRGQAPDAPA